MKPRDEIRDLCTAFLEGLESILGAKLHAVYLYGAVTFPETDYTGDVDFHVIVMEPPTEAERAALLGLHDRLARDFPPLGAELDGYYISLVDTRRSERPRHLLFPDLVDDSWALHRAHILAGRCIVLRGPDPKTIYVPPSWLELEKALDGELDYVAHHLAQYPAYCVLNLCRLMYSHETGDVVTSKAAAAAWGLDRLPEWRSLIEAARRSYAHEDTAEDRAALSRDVRSFYGFGVRTHRGPEREGSIGAAERGEMKIRVEDLRPELWPQVEGLFGKNGACGGCWCQAWRIEKGERWDDVKGAEAKERLRRGIESGTTFGVLAFDGEAPIGWCTYGPRTSFPRLERARSLRCEDAADVWSIPCFFVLRTHRRQGVAGVLLDRALRAMGERGATIAEGYPSAPNKDGSYIAAFSWTGTMPLFERAGFVLAGNADGSKRRMRKPLHATA